MSPMTDIFKADRNFDAFAKSLHQCLKRNQRALEAEGLVAELGALVQWTDRVYAGSMTAMDALEKYGAESLMDLKTRLSLALEEQNRAAEEFPETIGGHGQAIQHSYAEAFRDVSNALDQFLNATHPDPDTEGEDSMQIITPTIDKSVDHAADRKAATAVADCLARLLASTHTLYVKTLFYHWNVTGPQFLGLHQLFEDQYRALQEAGDELAERIRALGFFTPGTLSAFADLSRVKDDDRLPENANGMLKKLHTAHEACLNEAQKLVDLAGSAGDDVTADMATARMQFHAKAMWMLGASL